MRTITVRSDNSVPRIRGFRRVPLALVFCLMVPALALAQDAGASSLFEFVPKPAKVPGTAVSIPMAHFPNLVNSTGNPSVGGVRTITLDEVQQAAAGQNPMVRLGQLQVEAAKQNRQVFESSYFPQVSGTFANLHFNKFMGEEIQLRRPFLGVTTTVGLPLVGKDQTLAAFTVMQPLTPLLKVQQAVKIARADENIAKVKAGIPISESARNIEKNYFELLIAQRELTVAQIKSQRIQDKYLIASHAPVLLSAEQQAEMIGAEKILLVASRKVRELAASLNGMIGLSEDTELELVPPATEFRSVSLVEANQKALESNPEVLEAEQTVIKARAGRKLAKLDYVPDVAVLGGYAYQNSVIPLLPKDFSFIGVMATYSIFDGGKREHTLKQRNAQVEMAELAVTLTKAKVSAGVKSSYLEMERARELSELSQRMMYASQVVNASDQANSSELREVRASTEAEMFRAERAYREAYGRLKELMGER